MKPMYAVAEEQLRAYVDGFCTEQEADELETIIASHPELTRLFLAYFDRWAADNDAFPDPQEIQLYQNIRAAAFATTLKERLLQIPVQQSPYRSASRAFFKKWMILYVAAAIAAVILIVIALYRLKR